MPAKKIMKITFKTNELKAAMGKLAGFIGDTIVIDCTGQTLEGAPDKVLAQVRACNKTAQAMSVCCYAGDKEPKTMLFTNQIQSVVESLSVFGEELVIEPMEGAAKVSRGTASVNVPFASDAASIKAPNTTDALILLFKKEDFQNAVAQGAYVQEDGNLPALSKTCYFQPCKEGEKRTVKFSSTSGFLYAECECDIVNANEAFEKWTEKGVIVKAPALTSVARSLSSDNLYVYVTEKQLMIVAGNEVYNFITVEGTFQTIPSVRAKRFSKDFEMKLDKNKIKSAFKVIGLYTEAGDAQMSADVAFEETDGGKLKVTVKDINCKNQVEFEAEGFGNKEIRLNKTQIIRALDCTAGDTVTIHGTEDTAVVFISGSNEKAYSFNITGNAKKKAAK